tara:strand:+ start:38 stop:250 length:213 start_codon:yes stop_codon:yes gene_type:complete
MKNYTVLCSAGFDMQYEPCYLVREDVIADDPADALLIAKAIFLTAPEYRGYREFTSFYVFDSAPLLVVDG